MVDENKKVSCEYCHKPILQCDLAVDFRGFFDDEAENTWFSPCYFHKECLERDKKENQEGIKIRRMDFKRRF